MKLDFMPNKWILILIVGLALINPMQYILWIYFPEEGMTFVGNYDDRVLISSMESVNNNFQSPSGGSIFFDTLRLPLTYVPLGFLAVLFSMSNMAMYVISMFFSAIIYLLVVHHFMGLFMKSKQRNVAFVLFTLVSGIGWIFMLVMPWLTLSQVSYISYDVSSYGLSLVSQLARVYYSLSLACGYASLYFFIRNRLVLSFSLFWVCLFIHASIALIFYGLIFLYAFIKNVDKRFYYALLYLIPIGFYGLIFSVIPSLLGMPSTFNDYVGGIYDALMLPHAVILGSLPLLITIYKYRRKINDRFIFYWFFSIFLLCFITAFARIPFIHPAKFLFFLILPAAMLIGKMDLNRKLIIAIVAVSVLSIVLYNIGLQEITRTGTLMLSGYI